MTDWSVPGVLGWQYSYDEAMMRRYTGKWHRFDQPDPYDGSYDTTDPQSFNRYAYMQNDPVNFVDPTGLDQDGVWRRDPVDGHWQWFPSQVRDSKCHATSFLEVQC